MKILLLDDENNYGVLYDDYGGFIDSSVVDNIKSSYIYDIGWNSDIDLFRYKQGAGDSYKYLSIFPNAFRYCHTYTMRPTTAFAYETISFTIFTNIHHSLSVNELRNWFIAGNYVDSTLDNKIGKKLYPCSGIGAIVNSIPQSAVGLCYYSVTDGILITYTLYVYCNYGQRYSVDENTLNCTGIIDLFSGKRIL